MQISPFLEVNGANSACHPSTKSGIEVPQKDDRTHLAKSVGKMSALFPPFITAVLLCAFTRSMYHKENECLPRQSDRCCENPRVREQVCAVSSIDGDGLTILASPILRPQ